jgi:aminopeptidase N
VHVTAAEQSFRFVDVPVAPVPSLLRGFSAPVKLDFDYSAADLALLAAHDSDPVNRWDAAQRSYCDAILRAAARHGAGEPLALDPALAMVAGHLLADGDGDPALIALALAPPSLSWLAELVDTIDVDALCAARDFVIRELARATRPALLRGVSSRPPPPDYAPVQAQIGSRALRNRCLHYLGALDDFEARALAVAQYDSAGNMTDAIAALAAINHSAAPERAALFARFEAKWDDEPLVLDKWFALQATSQRPDTLARVEALCAHPRFNARNPNRVRSLVGAFAMHNWRGFHAADGTGYAFVAGQIMALDCVNPHVSSLLANAFNQWRRFSEPRRSRQRAALVEVGAMKGLSPDVREIVARSLAD